MSKQRNKKYSPYAQAQKAAIAFMSRKAVVWAGTKQATVFSISSMKPHAITRTEALAITEVQHVWSVYLLVMCRDHNKRDYLQVYPITPIQSKVEFISDSVQEELKKVVKLQNENHVVNIGWVCTTNRTELTDEQLDKMMTGIGGWEFLAKHEQPEESEPVELA